VAGSVVVVVVVVVVDVVVADTAATATVTVASAPSLPSYVAVIFPLYCPGVVDIGGLSVTLLTEHSPLLSDVIVAPSGYVTQALGSPLIDKSMLLSVASPLLHTTILWVMLLPSTTSGFQESGYIVSDDLRRICIVTSISCVSVLLRNNCA